MPAEQSELTFTQVGDLYPRAGQDAVKFAGEFLVRITGMTDNCAVVLEDSVDGVTWSQHQNQGIISEFRTDTRQRIPNASRYLNYRLRCTEHSGTPFTVALLGN
jgi:hypothetical protein